MEHFRRSTVRCQCGAASRFAAPAPVPTESGREEPRHKTKPVGRLSTPTSRRITMTKLSLFASWFLLDCFLTGERVLGWIPLSISSKGSSVNSRRATILRQQDRRVVENGDFFRERQNEFIKFESSDEEYGPGPALILYNVPQGVLDDQLAGILREAAPNAMRKGVSLSRMDMSTSSEWMDLSLKDALDKLIRNSKDLSLKEEAPLTTDAGLLATTPVLFFSGFRNSEMMKIFNVISHAVHSETMGRLSVACATAFPDSMDKRLKQVLREVAGEYDTTTVEPRAKRV